MSVATQYASAPCKLTTESFVFILRVAVLFRHNNIFVFIHQVAPVTACWLFKTPAIRWLLTLKVVSESHVTWATCANFSLPWPLCSRLRPNVRDRQTDVRQKHRLMPLPYALRHFVLFVCSVAWVFLLGSIGCHFQCKWLTGKIRLLNDL